MHAFGVKAQECHKNESLSPPSPSLSLSVHPWGVLGLKWQC